MNKRLTKPLQFDYDAATDVLTIEGVRYSGDFFRFFSMTTPPGRVVRAEKNEDGVVVLHQYDIAIEEFQKWIGIKEKHP